MNKTELVAAISCNATTVIKIGTTVNPPSTLPLKTVPRSNFMDFRQYNRINAMEAKRNRRNTYMEGVIYSRIFFINTVVKPQ